MAFVTDITALPAETQRILAVNAKGQGLTAEQYLISRGGVNPITSLYGDSYKEGVSLTDAEFLAAAGDAGKLNATMAAKENAYYLSTGQINPSQRTPRNASSISSTLAAQDPAVVAAEAARKDAMLVLADRFAKYGLSSLVSKIKELAISGASETTITLQLQETPEYQQRFSANAARIKKGLTVLSPAEYLATEDTYRQALRAYGLTQFDNDAYVSQFIANDMSPTELSNRIVTAVQRVQNADPAIAKQLKEYYGIGQTDLVAYVLDPEQQFQKIQRQVAASEIGVAAGRQGLTAGVNVAEQLAAQGITEAQAQKGYSTIADILPTAEKLSSIYATTEEGYNQATAEQEVFNSLASAQRARQRLTSREVSTFSGSSGMAKASLSQSKTAGQL
jgi:hypothetical protein